MCRAWAEIEAFTVAAIEGWCVGARPIADADLANPINALEREEDREGVWRRAWNAALARSYPALFARIDRLVLLEAPGWETVLRWRTEQEHALRAAGGSGPGVMDDAAIAHFIQHYERLTRHILQDMPGYADLVLPLDEARNLRVT